MTLATIEFVETHEDCLLRSQLSGHLTGSAWVVDRTRNQTLLTHHRKLDKWLQLGGHADGDPDLLAVARAPGIQPPVLSPCDQALAIWRECRDEKLRTRLSGVSQLLRLCVSCLVRLGNRLCLGEGIDRRRTPLASTLAES